MCIELWVKWLYLVIWDFFCNFASELRKLAAPQHNSNKFDSASVCTIIALEFVRDDNLVSQVCIFLVLKVLIFLKNMIEKIGTNAGLVWHALEAGKLELKAIKKATKLTEKEIYAALGWLARENKVAIAEEGKEVFVELI